MSIKGTVLRLERASVHDGPGIRTVVFMKGCPLRCEWCSTPESQSFIHQKGFMAVKCTGCGRCVSACTNGAITVKDGNALTDRTKCRECLDCVSACLKGANVAYGKEMTSDEVVREILKDEIFFFHSSGGVTFSGGEPLFHAEFVADALRKIKDHAINTAIETTLHTPYSNVEKVIPLVDYLYIDIKHTDRELHNRWVGSDNKLIMENLSKISASDYKGKITIRVPLIPGINDSDENLLHTAELCKTIKQFQYLELLPYHRIGTGTYQYLGIQYKLNNIKSMNNEQLDERIGYLNDVIPELDVRIG